MSIEAEIYALRPSVQSVQLNSSAVLHFEFSTPAHQFDIFNHLRSGYYIQIRARDGYNVEIIDSLLQKISNIECSSLPIDELTVMTVGGIEGSGFTQIGIAPPMLAECFKNQSDRLQSIGYWVFPLYEGEFRGGETRSDFHFDIGNRGRRIKVIDMQRQKKSELV